MLVIQLTIDRTHTQSVIQKTEIPSAFAGCFFVHTKHVFCMTLCECVLTNRDQPLPSLAFEFQAQQNFECKMYHYILYSKFCCGYVCFTYVGKWKCFQFNWSEVDWFWTRELDNGGIRMIHISDLTHPKWLLVTKRYRFY